MIKFFRNIRKSLLSEGKRGKYLKYAIGEILLVMVGILLALQVSNWNQNRKDRISERKLLDNIHRDFLANKTKFDSLKTLNYRNVALLDTMCSLFPLDSDSIKSRRFNELSRSINEISFNPYSSTVESIINSNALELIENEELQEYLVAWKDVLLDFQEEEDAYFKMMNDHYYPYVVEAFDFFNIDQEVNKRASRSREYRNRVSLRRGYLIGIVNAIENESIEHHINKLVRLTTPEDE